VMEADDLQSIARFARQRDVIVCSDEAYETLVYDGRKFLSIASLDGMQDRTVIIRTFSKTYAMTGWRIGYLAAPAKFAKRAGKLHEHTSACTSSVSQMAALTALDTSDDVSQSMVEEYESRRDIVMQYLQGVPEIRILKPQGTFYAFVDISSFGLSSFDFSRRLLEKARVAVAPGSAFGEEGEGYIRICFANSVDNIKRGLERMEKMIKKLS
jgi:aminotransferase